MGQQLSFAQAEYAGEKKTTGRDKFLSEMNQVAPWARLVELVRPHYPAGKRGRPPMGIEKMLRVYFLQQWHGLADEALEDTIYDSQAMRGFAGIDLGGRSSVPDAAALSNFRHLLEEHELTRRILEEVNAHLTERGLLMREGTLVAAAIIAAPSSTKNKSGERDPEMHQTKKGNQWFSGMKAHIGADAASGLVHSVTGTGPTCLTSARRASFCMGRKRWCMPTQAASGWRRGKRSSPGTAVWNGGWRPGAASSRGCRRAG